MISTTLCVFFFFSNTFLRELFLRIWLVSTKMIPVKHFQRPEFAKLNPSKCFRIKDSEKYNSENIFKNNVFTHWFDNQNDNATTILNIKSTLPTVVHSAVFTGHLVFTCKIVGLIFRNDNSLIMRRE